jgi:hypothetical protein
VFRGAEGKRNAKEALFSIPSGDHRHINPPDRLSSIAHQRDVSRAVKQQRAND